MNASDFGIGDTVSLKAKVVDVDPDMDGDGVCLMTGWFPVWVPGSGLTLVEKAKPPVYSNSATEPQRGDVALAPDGLCLYWWQFWTRQDDGERATTPTAPLWLLVRDGREFRGDQ